MMFTSSAQGSTPGVPGAHTASLAPEQADSISEIFADGLGNGENIEEESGKAGRLLLHAGRLLRDRDRYVERFGQRNYEIKLGDCMWHVYRLLGKLSGQVYVLTKT